MPRTPLFALAGLALLGCEREPTTVNITSPMNNATVTTAMATIAFDTGFFRYEPPGECPYERQCGQVFLNIDGDACNASGETFNATGPMPGAMPGRVRDLPANFTLCPELNGPHEITVTVMTEDGFVEATHSIMVTVDVPPGIALTLAPGDTVTLGADPDQSLDVDFTVTNFTLQAAGTCGDTADCGHVELRIDGTACNEPGTTFNAEGTAAPLAAHFARCPTPTGLHEIELALHDDTHTPLSSPSATARVIVSAE